MSEPGDWKTLYAAAMLESDAKRVPQRIQQADEAIRTRMQQLPDTSSPRSEQAELRYALSYLCRLKVA